MEKHFELSDKEFAAQFANCTLDPVVFSHEAHLRLAWIHIRQSGIDDAVEVIQAQLKHYVAFLGAADKYNMTLTIAATRAVYHCMLKSTAQDFAGFIQSFPRLKTHFKELMAAHYAIDIFNTPLAKSHYLAPDLLPFD